MLIALLSVLGTAWYLYLTSKSEKTVSKCTSIIEVVTLFTVGWSILTIGLFALPRLDRYFSYNYAKFTPFLVGTNERTELIESVKNDRDNHIYDVISFKPKYVASDLCYFACTPLVSFDTFYDLSVTEATKTVSYDGYISTRLLNNKEVVTLDGVDFKPSRFPRQIKIDGDDVYNVTVRYRDIQNRKPVKTFTVTENIN